MKARRIAAALVLALVLASPAAANAPTANPIPPRVRGELLTAARTEAAKRFGENRPSDIEAVRTTLGRARTDEGESPSSSEYLHAPVYLVAMRGNFNCGVCSRPKGARAIRGSVLTLMFDARTLRLNERGLGRRYPRMKLAGQPIRLG